MTPKRTSERTTGATEDLDILKQSLERILVRQ